MSSRNAADEKEMVLLLSVGDAKAFDYFYQSYSRRIYIHLKRLLHSDELAEEYLQEVFYKLWLKREKLDPEKAFAAYLYRIATNIVYDYFRKAALDKNMQEHLIATGTELYEHVDLSLECQESYELLQKAIEALPPQRQRVFQLCKVEGRSYEEVSAMLGISTSTINDHIVKATRLIKKQFAGPEHTAILLLLACFSH